MQSISLPSPSLPTGCHPAHRLALSPVTLSYRDVEDFLAEGGLDVSYETGAQDAAVQVRRFNPTIPLLACRPSTTPSMSRVIRSHAEPCAACGRVRWSNGTWWPPPEAGCRRPFLAMAPVPVTVTMPASERLHRERHAEPRPSSPCPPRCRLTAEPRMEPTIQIVFGGWP